MSEKNPSSSAPRNPFESYHFPEQHHKQNSVPCRGLVSGNIRPDLLDGKPSPSVPDFVGYAKEHFGPIARREVISFSSSEVQFFK